VKPHLCKRIGHGGASALAPANTLASFDMAREIGVDIVEFDIRVWRGELVLAHTRLDAPRPWNLRLQEALCYLSGPDFREIELNADVKQMGCESALLDVLRDARMLERTVISSQMPAVLDRVRAIEPSARVAISVGGRVARISRRWSDWREQVLAGLAARRWDALMAQHRLIDRRLLEDVVARSGLLYAWTVNERKAIGALQAMGVHGIATADPRLFTA
jgi:glycerophosphoryl diester phosphodiesterase